MTRFSMTVCLAATLFSAPAHAAVDDCMVGTWIADLRDIADMMSVQMQGTATPTNGEVSMEILPDGMFTLLADDMTLSIAIPDIPVMSVKVVGYSAGRIDAADNAFIAAVDDYTLVGSADVLGQTMEIPFDSATGMGGGGIGWFECTADTLRFEATAGGEVNPNQMPRLWHRR
ncbi:hypothetical protein SAMN04488005_0052 [Yoonia tamlensis]|uniref:Uncharacterized protein n=1 Tax=Yoonia tamlensis TaxID=390270 RepID=A0A1I6FNC7_9RHOB|nr:hypothetical protein [Yoonia tamlensis]SFR31459.1 hypothetical protein SAMN04488005_0052 [Yoonia tamlensis]